MTDANQNDVATIRVTRKQLDLLNLVMRMYKDQALAARYEQAARDTIEILTLFNRGYVQMRSTHPGAAAKNRRKKKRARATIKESLAELAEVTARNTRHE